MNERYRIIILFVLLFSLITGAGCSIYFASQKHATEYKHDREFRWGILTNGDTMPQIHRDTAYHERRKREREQRRKQRRGY